MRSVPPRAFKWTIPLKRELPALAAKPKKENHMSTLQIVLVVVLLLGGGGWSYSRWRR